MAVSKLRACPEAFLPDDHQREAIEHAHGPMLVVAGAGTGKTSVLTHRIAWLVSQGHARPDEILALTYTKNAAAEMRERGRSLLGGTAVRAATFHDYCFELLGRHEEKFGVLDEKDLWIFLRKRIRDLHLEYFVRAANVGQFLNDLLDFLSRCHDELVTPEKYAAYVQGLECGEFPLPRVAKSKDDVTGLEAVGRCREIARVFGTAERWLREQNLGTFSHMITRAHDLLTTNENVRLEEQAAARFILVDEFQDANFAQIKILSALAGEQRNLFGVGDPDQAIYRFRGASSAAFQLFRRQFPEMKLIVLGKNRRSTTSILRCAFAHIDKNPPGFPPAGTDAIAYVREPLQSAREEEGAKQGTPVATFPVEAISFAGRDAEGPDVLQVIEEIRRRLRCPWKDFAILYRSHVHRDDLVQQLAEKEIPFSIESLDVSDTSEVRDLVACLYTVVDLGDDASLFRVAALPNFAVDGEQLRTTLRAIAKDSRDGHATPLATVLSQVAGGAEVLERVMKAREALEHKNAKGRKAVKIIADQFALESSPMMQAALKFVEEWEHKPTTQTGDMRELVEYLRLFREAGGTIPMTSSEDQDAVRLMTVHTAKGLEFAHVFILRAMSPSFPAGYRETLVEFPVALRDPDSAPPIDDKTLYVQEERRLFYVAMTRAKDSLRIYGKQGTGKDQSPPGYMRELMKDATLSPWLRCRPALPSQPELIEIAAVADSRQPNESRTAEWLALPPVPGLGARLSASAVDTYERCPLQFRLEREWKLSHEVPAAMQYGATMHRVLRTYYDSVRQQRPKTEDELIGLFRDDLASAGFEDPYQQVLYEKQGIEQLRNFLAAVRSLSMPEVLHTEEGFEVQIGGVTVAGRIDRIDRTADSGVLIVDYKTGKARTQDDADQSLQLSIYALAAQEKWRYPVRALAFHNLEDNVFVITRRSEFELADARERVEAAARNIAAGNFKPKVDFHCNFCAFRGLCPAKEKRIPVVASGRKGQHN